MSNSIDNNHPIGGVDYPRTIQEFDEWFPNENAYVAYLLRMRWPNGFICPVCRGTKGWLTARQQIRCVGCQRQTSVTAGTIFEGTRKPLGKWFQTTWHVTNQKFGGSALGLQRAAVLSNSRPSRNRA